MSAEWPLPIYICDCGVQDARNTRAWCPTCARLRVPIEVVPAGSEVAA